jgi:hypothetical protein
MLVPEHISPILVSAGVGVAGKDLFCHTIPATVSAGLAIVGSLAGSDIDYDLPGWRQGRIQVIVRNANHQAGLTKSRQVIAALTLNDRDLPAVAGAPAIRLRRLRAIHDPIVYPRSTGDVLEFSMNFEAIWIVR